MISGISCTRCGAAIPSGTRGACPRCLLGGDSALVGGVLALGDELGRGGMGTVFRARHARLDREVAVKFLPAHLADDPSMRARFEREAQALARLSHPNIVQVHDVGEEDGQPYIVMELVEGPSLSEGLPLPPARAIAIVIETCEALTYAHAKGVIHRDIKPENILLDASGHVKVTDFGIARLVGDPAVTAPQTAIGTPHFLAPEVLRGAAPDPRQDVYALGVVLYQLLTGKLPIGDFEPLPGRVDGVVRAALAPDPAKRLASPEALRAALCALPVADPEELPPDELFWIRGAALLSTVAAALSLLAGVVSLTPRIIERGELMALVQIPPEQLADGRLVSRARFETSAVLGAVVALAIASAALGLLRRHWRLSGLDRPRPGVPLRQARVVAIVGLASAVVWAIHRGLFEHQTRFSAYVPFFGGVLEVCVLYVFFLAMLDAWRTSRPLSREPWLFLGLALAIVPPAGEFLSYVSRWRP